MLFYLYFSKFFFRISVCSGQLLRCGHIVPTRKLNRVKNGHSVLFAKRIRVFPFPILNTDQYGQNMEFYSLKYGSPYIDLNRLEKNFGSVFFAFRAG